MSLHTYSCIFSSRRLCSGPQELASPWPRGCLLGQLPLKEGLLTKAWGARPVRKPHCPGNNVPILSFISKGTRERTPSSKKEHVASYSQPCRRLQAKRKGQGHLLEAGFQRPEQIQAGPALAVLWHFQNKDRTEAIPNKSEKSLAVCSMEERRSPPAEAFSP